MLYITNNEKLVNLLEKWISGDIGPLDINDTRDLITELRNKDGEVSLHDWESIKRRSKKYLRDHRSEYYPFE